MHHFDYRNGVLHCEGVNLQTLADQFGTPTYVYSTATLERHYQVLHAAFTATPTLVAFSVKANGNLGVLRTLAAQGAGADVVSGGELQRALRAGIPASRIVFSGVAKSEADLTLALQAGIRLFNIESAPELHRLSRLAIALSVCAPIAFRVNPHVAAGGHANISTGKADDKFGVAWHEAEALYAEAASLPGINPIAVDVHIGSQIEALAPMREAFTKVIGLVDKLRANGIAITTIDLGGGLAIPYRADDAPAPPTEYAAMIAGVVSGRGLDLILEPGRMIAGNAGILLSRVEYIKDRDGRRFIILDAGMNDLLRPALYDAHHDIVPVRQPEAAATTNAVDVVGPVCESTDRFAEARLLPPLAEGDLVAIMSAGAYGAAMASQYNARPLAAEVLVRDTHASLVRRRPDFNEMIALEAFAPWQA
jgi:diaminopimelate decarboxylase